MTIRARAPVHRSSRSEAGFTLVEILMVLALMALAATVLIPATGALFNRRGGEDVAEIMSDVLQQARREAVLTGREVVMRFDAPAQRFTWSGGGAAHQFALAGPRTAVEFLWPTGGGAILLGGQLVETGAKPVLTFFPDGTCDPVRVQFRPETGAGRVLAIDPWTCAPGLDIKP